MIPFQALQDYCPRAEEDFRGVQDTVDSIYGALNEFDPYSLEMRNEIESQTHLWCVEGLFFIAENASENKIFPYQCIDENGSYFTQIFDTNLHLNGHVVKYGDMSSSVGVIFNGKQHIEGSSGEVFDQDRIELIFYGERPMLHSTAHLQGILVVDEEKNVALHVLHHTKIPSCVDTTLLDDLYEIIGDLALPLVLNIASRPHYIKKNNSVKGICRVGFSNMNANDFALLKSFIDSIYSTTLQIDFFDGLRKNMLPSFSFDGWKPGLIQLPADAAVYMTDFTLREQKLDEETSGLLDNLKNICEYGMFNMPVGFNTFTPLFLFFPIFFVSQNTKSFLNPKILFVNSERYDFSLLESVSDSLRRRLGELILPETIPSIKTGDKTAQELTKFIGSIRDNPIVAVDPDIFVERLLTATNGAGIVASLRDKESFDEEELLFIHTHLFS
ncbi:hypothetical protein PCE1_004709 [Barthelona sp. PCE]